MAYLVILWSTKDVLVRRKYIGVSIPWIFILPSRIENIPPRTFTIIFKICFKGVNLDKFRNRFPIQVKIRDKIRFGG
jgi:hypothetical protein